MLQRSKSVLGYVLLGMSIGCICGLSRTVLAQVIHGSIYGQVTDSLRRRRSQCHHHGNRQEQGNVRPGDHE